MNRFTKKIFVTLVVVGFGVGAAGLVAAQETPEQRVERLAEKLDLSAAQKVKLEKMFKDRRAQADKIRADKSLTGDQKKAQIKALRQAGRAEMAGVLTADQKAKLEQMRSERKGQRGDGKRAEKLAKALDLTPAQQTQFKAVMSDARAERDAIIAANDGDRDAAQPELQVHREKTQAKIRALLTPEQIKKLDALKAQRGDRNGKGKRGGRDF